MHVSGVTEGEAGALSGFNLNDSIVSVDDSVPIKSLGELTEHIQTKQADGNKITMNFKVQAAPVNSATAALCHGSASARPRAH